MTSLSTCCIPRLYELTDPGTAWLRNVVLDHGAGIKVVDGHNERRCLVAVFGNDLAQRWGQIEVLHATDMGLLFLLR